MREAPSSSAGTQSVITEKIPSASLSELLPQRLAEIEDRLREKGVIREEAVPNGESTVRVIDLQRLASDDSLDNILLRISQKEVVTGEIRHFNKRDILFRLLKDEVGITPEQLEQGDFTPKPFLYIPATADTATQSRHIKNAKFHAAIWELAATRRPFDPHLTQDETSEISQREVEFATKLFHPRFGDAYRDETGTLLMKDPHTREYVPFSFLALRPYGIDIDSITGSANSRVRFSTGQEAMRARLPNMVRSGLLRPDSDVRAMTVDKDGGTRGVERTITNKKYVMIGRVNHYLDRNGLQGTFSLETVGAIALLRDVSTGEVAYTFNIIGKDELQPTPSGWFIAGAEDTRPRKLDAIDFTNAQRPFETVEAFKGRIAVVHEGLQKILVMAKELPALANLVRAEEETVRRSLGDALRFIAETTSASELFSQQFAGADSTVTRQLLSVYADLMQSADSMEEFVREQFACKDTQCEQMVREARADVLNRARLFIEGVALESDQDSAALLKKLENFRISATVFASAFRSFHRSGEQVTWEDIKQSSFECVPATELSAEDVVMMQQVWEAQYKGKYESASLEGALREQFLLSLKDQNTRVHVFKHEGQVVSFFFAEDGESSLGGLPQRHLSSFLTDPAYEGGGLGLAIMREGLVREQAGAVLVGESDVDPVRTPIVSQYFERYGFVASRAYMDHDEPTLKLERWEGNQFKTKDPKLTREIIAQRADTASLHPHQQYLKSVRVPDFESLLKDGYYLTRYFAVIDENTKQPVYYAVLERPIAEPVTP